MVLDLPSSLSRLTVSALAAADGIVIPVTASVVGLHGPGREVVDAYARLVDYLLERVTAAAEPAQ
jgi:cellulose biosynthesis protein BcsQ